MRDDGWEVKSPFPRVAPKAPSTPARNYSRPHISKVAVALEVDELHFSPESTSGDGSAVAFANIPSGSIVLPHGGTAVVDCGFSMTIPPGYRTRVSSAVSGLVVEVVESKRFKVTVINVGSEAILEDRGAIARLWIEPIYFFEWTKRF